MNHKIFLVSAFLLLLSFAAEAQIGRLKGVEGVEVIAGISELGYFINPNYSYNLSNSFVVKAGPFYERGNYYDVNFSSIGADAKANWHFWNMKQILYFSLQGGVTGSYDFISNFHIENPESSKGLKYGLFGGWEAEFHKLRKVVIVVNGNQRVLFGTDFGMFRYQIGVGLRYIL